MKLLIILSVSCAIVSGRPQIQFPGKFSCRKLFPNETHFGCIGFNVEQFVWIAGISISSSNANANSASGGGGPFGKLFDKLRVKKLKLIGISFNQEVVEVMPMQTLRAST